MRLLICFEQRKDNGGSPLSGASGLTEKVAITPVLKNMINLLFEAITSVKA